ncbi:hypothetical protein C8R46DRAFT_437603 [Mycena filopes]|nr:hypothetical protein C8R46DRAFT_437603 [Mycena filopes]
MLSALRRAAAPSVARTTRIQLTRPIFLATRTLTTETTPRLPLWLGHTVKQCREPVICIACGNKGHWRARCPNPDPVKVAQAYAKHACYRCGDTGHTVPECTAPPPPCYHCGEEGHLILDCEKWRETVGERVAHAHVAGRGRRDPRAPDTVKP